MGAATLLFLSSIACFQYLPTSCQAHKINSNHEGQPSVTGFVLPVLRSGRPSRHPPTTFDFAPIDESVPIPTPLSANNGMPSMPFRWRCNKIQMHAKNLKRSISDVQVEEKFGQDIILNGVDVNGSANDVDSNNKSPVISNANGEEEVDDEIEKKHDMQMMQMAIGMAASTGGERGSHGPFPRPVCGAVLVAKDGRVSLFLLLFSLSLLYYYSRQESFVPRISFLLFLAR